MATDRRARDAGMGQVAILGDMQSVAEVCPARSVDHDGKEEQGAWNCSTGRYLTTNNGLHYYNGYSDSWDHSGAMGESMKIVYNEDYGVYC